MPAPALPLVELLDVPAVELPLDPVVPLDVVLPALLEFPTGPETEVVKGADSM